MKLHKEQPSLYDINKIGGIPELTKEQKEGIEIAAYICRMYSAGEIFAEAIESHGEQIRALYWMKVENKNG